MPKRKFESAAEFGEYMEGVDEIIFDGFENTLNVHKGMITRKLNIVEKKAHTPISPF